MEKKVQREATRFSFLIRYGTDDQNKENEIGGTCGTYRGKFVCIQGLFGET